MPLLGAIPENDLSKLSAGSLNGTEPQNLTDFGHAFASNSTMTFPIGLPPETTTAFESSATSPTNSSTSASKRAAVRYSDEEFEASAERLDQTVTDHVIFQRQSDSYWLSNVAHGVSPLAPSGYKFFRNVKDYGAVGDGVTEYVSYRSSPDPSLTSS